MYKRQILDPALLRPSRFDRQIYVGYPDIKGREDVLKIHTANKPLAEDVDLAKVARGTAGFTGADLENLSNEAALLLSLIHISWRALRASRRKTAGWCAPSSA